MSDYAFGVDIGGTRVKLGLVDLVHGTLIKSRIYPSSRDEKTFLTDLRQEVCAMLKENGLTVDAIRGLGASVSGFVRTNGIMGKTDSAFLPFLSEYPIRNMLESAIGLQVRVDSDGRMVCYGECLYGAGRNYHRVVMITLGTGIGFCFLEDAILPRAPALLHMGGHIKVHNSNTPCYCGLCGCFEQYCSGTALSNRYRSLTGNIIDSEEIFYRAQDGESLAVSLVSEYLDDLCCGLNQIIYSHAPDVIIIGGGVANSLKGYFLQISNGVHAKCYDNHNCAIHFTELGDMAGIYGAASLFLE